MQLIYSIIFLCNLGHKIILLFVAILLFIVDCILILFSAGKIDIRLTKWWQRVINQ